MVDMTRQRSKHPMVTSHWSMHNKCVKLSLLSEIKELIVPREYLGSSTVGTSDLACTIYIQCCHFMPAATGHECPWTDIAKLYSARCNSTVELQRASMFEDSIGPFISILVPGLTTHCLIGKGRDGLWKSLSLHRVCGIRRPS